jgi:predicted TPR repeat methyltransferase
MTSADAPDDPGLDDILTGAVGLLREERLSEAETAFEAVLRRWPQQPDALHFLGVLRHAQGRTDEAVALVRESLAVRPADAGAWNNLGNILLLAGRADDAAKAYRQSVEAGAGAPSAQALTNLAVLYRKQGRPADAERACRDAVALNPEDGDAWYRLSQALLDQGQVREGLLANSRAVALWPTHQQARGDVLRALVMLGERQRAAALYREWLAEEPDNPVAQHLLSAIDGADAPPRASDGYIEEVFDGFSNSFDAKLEALQYRAPGLVEQAVGRAFGAPAAALDIADLGCGTGLCGPLLRPYARRLAGCDLSVGMLRRAKARKVYDVLHKAELGYYLETQPEHFDALVSADTLIYFGDLRPVMRQARQALRPGGWLVFTVERLAADETDTAYRLTPTGRYAHHVSHLREALAGAGFADAGFDEETMRTEAGQAVRGWLVSARRP